MNIYETIRVDKSLPLPFKKRKTDAGHDLFSSESGWVLPFRTRVFKSNHRILIGEGDKGLVFARSSIRRKGMTIEGVIDAGYTGIIGIMITNNSIFPKKVKKAERICQILFNNTDTQLVEVDEFSIKTDRGENGFGSSGVK